MISLVKMSIKLLLRNKGFLFFLLVTPIVSTFILSIKMDTAIIGSENNQNVIIELDRPNNKAVYNCNTSACIIKVYDGSKSELSEYVLEQLASNGMFSVCRADVRDLTEEDVKELAKKDAYNDRTAMILYIKNNFDSAVIEGSWEQAIKLYEVSKDERQELFKDELTGVFARLKQVQLLANNDVTVILNTLKDMENNMPAKEVVNLAGGGDVELTLEQTNQKSQIGYSFAIITLGFLFCGVCVAHSVIEEQNNKVFTRVMLSKISSREYFMSKFIVAFIISVLQTVVLGVCLVFVNGIDFGISIFSYLLVIFMLGLIFSTLSLLLGVLLGDVMSSNYAVFAIWSISALLAGLYFPLDDTTKALKMLSYLMPQKWFVDGTKLLLVNDNSAYSMLLCVTVAYLVVIISVGGVGLKIKKYE